jgi:hypothetical protein
VALPEATLSPSSSRGGGKRASPAEMDRTATVSHNNFIIDRKFDE